MKRPSSGSLDIPWYPNPFDSCVVPLETKVPAALGFPTSILEPVKNPDLKKGLLSKTPCASVEPAADNVPEKFISELITALSYLKSDSEKDFGPPNSLILT